MFAIHLQYALQQSLYFEVHAFNFHRFNIVVINGNMNHVLYLLIRFHLGR